MQLALRPYVTTGVAIVGASVIAVAPIVPTPTEIQVPNPLVQVDRSVTLTANEIEDAFNQLIFAATDIGLRLATLPAPLVAQLLGVSNEEAQAFLALGAVGLAGPLISGPGAIGSAIQDVVDQLGSGNFAALLNALIGAPATVIDGFVNGGFGPDLSPLLQEALIAVMPALGALEMLGLPFPAVFAGGLINEQNVESVIINIGIGTCPGMPPACIPIPLPLAITLPGTIPTLQGLVDRLIGLLTGASDMMAVAAVVPVESEGAIEGAVNALLLNLVARPIVTVAGLLGTVLAPVLGAEEAALLPIAALGLFGPLISGPGAIGTALQDVVDSLGSGDFAGVLSELIGAPATVIDGVVNGGYGPDLAGLVVPLLFPDLPSQLFPDVRAGGLINELDVQLIEVPFPPFVLPTGVTLPGTIPTLQGLVSQILGLVGLAAPAPEPVPVAATLSEETSISSFDTSNQRLVTLDVAPDLGEEGDGKQTTPDITPAADEKGGTAGVSADLNSHGKGEDANVKDTKPGPDVGGGPKTGALDMTGGAKFEPEKKNSEAEGNNGSDPNTVGTTVVTNESGDPVNSTADPDPSEDGEE